MPIRRYPFTVLGNQPPRPYLPVIVRNPDTGQEIDTWCLIDTGADRTFIPGKIAKAIGHNVLQGFKRKCGTGGGSVIAYDHTCELDVLAMDENGQFLRNEIRVTIPSGHISVMPTLAIPLLGVNEFLGRHILNIDYPKYAFSVRLPTK